MASLDLTTWARRVALAVVAAFFVVNVLTGPGVPEIIEGRPALVAHSTIHCVTWPIYWLTDLLIISAFVFLAVAFVLSRWPRSASGAAAATQASREILLRERFTGGRIGPTYYRMALDARLMPDRLELRENNVFGSGEPFLRVPLADLGPVWFVHRLDGWSISWGEGASDLRNVRVFPRNPRRWFEDLGQLSVPLRPVGLSADKLPRLQVGWVAQIGCTATMIAAGLAILAFFVVKVVVQVLLRSIFAG